VIVQRGGGQTTSDTLRKSENRERRLGIHNIASRDSDRYDTKYPRTTPRIFAANLMTFSSSLKKITVKKMIDFISIIEETRLVKI